MATLPQRILIVNSASELAVLTANPSLVSPVSASASGVTFTPFAGWTSTNFVQLAPLATTFKQADIVHIRKTSVKGNNTAYTANSPDYSAITLMPGNVPDVRQVISTEARRPANHVQTLTLNSVPAPDKLIVINYSLRTIDNTSWQTQAGGSNVRTLIRTTIPTTVTTTAQLAAYIVSLLDASPYIDYAFTWSVSGNVITITGKENGVFIDLYFKGAGLVDVFDLDATAATTLLPFAGVNNYAYMTKYHSNPYLWSRINDPSHTFNMVTDQNAYYTSYDICYRVNSSWEVGLDESQSAAVNSRNQHDFGCLIYVNQNLTALITQLDLLLA
jgi:hypothetical protein